MIDKKDIERCFVNGKFANRTFYKMKQDKNMLNFTTEDAYLIFYNIEKPKCYCGNYLKFRSFNVGYSSFCSNKCSNNDETVKIKQKENYDTTKAGAKISKKWSERSPEQIAKIQLKQKQTKLEIYGDENYNNRPKFKETCLERYGVENPMMLEDISNKTMKTQHALYGGVFNPSKFKETCLERYGVDIPLKNKDVAKNFSKLLSRKYGGTKSKVKGVVYFLESEKYIKIGCSASFKSRLKVLEKEYGSLKIIKVIHTEDMYRLESIIHQTYDEYNIVLEEGSGRTEWFKKDILTENLLKDDYEN